MVFIILVDFKLHDYNSKALCRRPAAEETMRWIPSKGDL